MDSHVMVGVANPEFERREWESEGRDREFQSKATKARKTTQDRPRVHGTVLRTRFSRTERTASACCAFRVFRAFSLLPSSRACFWILTFSCSCFWPLASFSPWTIVRACAQQFLRALPLLPRPVPRRQQSPRLLLRLHHADAHALPLPRDRSLAIHHLRRASWRKTFHPPWVSGLPDGSIGAWALINGVPEVCQGATAGNLHIPSTG